MPNIEPEVEAAMKWEKPDEQNGKKTLPIGPIRWEEGPDGEMQAWGVGSENGTPRRRLVFTIPKPVGWRTAPVANTPAFEKGDPLTTVGSATHPPDTGEDISETPPSETPSASGTGTPALVPSTIPATSESIAPSVPPTASETPAQTELPIRLGTSETRYTQQDQTHASGQLASGTPHAAVNDHGHGDKTVTMEPNTVGQAPKEKPLPEPEQPAAPSYLDQAKAAAASATAVVGSTVTSVAGTVAGAAGGNKQAEEKVEEPARSKSPEEKELDGKIDASHDKHVEAFLREKHMSKE